jgi:Ubiquitin carboxyl-terminal hydrolase
MPRCLVSLLVTTAFVSLRFLFSSCRIKLFGVSEHSGATANSGHYTATVRNSKNNNWYRYNDSHVGSTSGEASVTGGAYLLFYQRVKGTSRWGGMEKAIQNQGKPQVDAEGFMEIKKKKKKSLKKGKL